MAETDLAPAARHARILAELKRRLEVCEAHVRMGVQMLSTFGKDLSLAHRETLRREELHAAELAALIKIVERHKPEEVCELNCAAGCHCNWPCADFLSAERAVGMPPEESSCT